MGFRLHFIIRHCWIRKRNQMKSRSYFVALFWWTFAIELFSIWFYDAQEDKRKWMRAESKK